VVRQLGDWTPGGRLPGGRSVKNGLTRSLRDGLLATAGEFAGQAGQAIGQLLRLRVTGPGGPAGFESYLKMVERADRYGHLG
jgi:hypothetical protein